MKIIKLFIVQLKSYSVFLIFSGDCLGNRTLQDHLYTCWDNCTQLHGLMPCRQHFYHMIHCRRVYSSCYYKTHPVYILHLFHILLVNI